MPPPLGNWKRWIDNGNSIDGQPGNFTEPVNPTGPSESDNDPVKRPQLPQGVSGVGSDLLPVYCGLLGCLIVGLIAWIVFKQLRRRPAAHEDKLPTMGEDAEPDQHDHRQLRHNHHRHQRQGQQGDQLRLFHPPQMRSQKRRSADSGFYGSETASATATAEVQIGAGIRRCLLRDLSESRLQRLENILANDPNPDGWRRLARELGLGADDLARLESHQSARGNQSAIRLMLKTWAARDSSSVGQLVQCLQRAGRSDALILFRESGLPTGLKRGHRKARKLPQMQLHLPAAEAAASADAEVSGTPADVANIVEPSEPPPSV